jgi:hypothetical protein
MSSQQIPDLVVPAETVPELRLALLVDLCSLAGQALERVPVASLAFVEVDAAAYAERLNARRELLEIVGWPDQAPAQEAITFKAGAHAQLAVELLGALRNREAGRLSRDVVPAGELSEMEAHDLILLRSETELREMEGYLLSLDRDQPVVAIGPAIAPGSPTLAPDDARSTLGSAPRLYVLADDDLLDLRGLPSELALTRGCSARIWQPGLTTDSDPDDHPLVRPLGTENVLEVLALQFDLSRPRVRREIKRIEGIRVFTELQLDNAIEQMDSKCPPRALTKAGL